MIYPTPIIPGCTLGVTACSDGTEDPIKEKRLDNAGKHWKALGYQVKETSNVRKSIKGRSGPPEERARELESLWNVPDVKGVFMAGGGDFMFEMLDQLQWDILAESPKWVQGYSDPTSLLFALTTRYDMATIYGNNFSDFGMAQWHPSLTYNRQILEGRPGREESYALYQDGFGDRVTGLEAYQADRPVVWKTLGEENSLIMKGRLLGGCLDVLLDVMGTPFDGVRAFQEKYESDGIIWFLESFAISTEGLERAFWRMEQNGWLQHTKGMFLGRPAFTPTFTDTTYEEALKRAAIRWNFPVIWEGDLGHKPPRMTFVNGAMGTIGFKNGKGWLETAFL